MKKKRKGASSPSPSPSPSTSTSTTGQRGTWRLVGLLTGPLYALSFPDAGLAPLMLVAFVPLLIAIRGLSPRRRFFLGMGAGFLAWFIGYYTVAGLLTRMSDVPPLAAWPLFSLVCAYHGLAFGLFALGAEWLRILAPRFAWLTLATLSTALDLVFPQLFPWFPGSAAAALGPFGAALDLIGVYGMGFLMIAASSPIADALFALARERRFVWHPLVAVACGAAIVFGYGLWRTADVRDAMTRGKPLRYALVQPSYSAQERRSSDAAVMTAMGDRVVAQLASLPAGELDLVLLGESAFPFPYVRREPPPREDAALPTDRFAARFSREAKRLGAHVVFGAPRFASGAPDAPASNSLVHLGPDGAVVRIYDKIRLVPFGERMPFGFLRSLFPRFEDLLPGADRAPFEIAGHRLAPTICYELMFPEDGRAAANAGATALLNATNDVWFGAGGNAQALHFALQRPRAIENRMTLVRAANTGVSGIVRPDGTIAVASGLDRPEIVRGTETIAAIGSVYRSIGDWWFAAPGAATLAIAAIAMRRRRRAKGAPVRPGPGT